MIVILFIYSRVTIALPSGALLQVAASASLPWLLRAGKGGAPLLRGLGAVLALGAAVVVVAGTLEPFLLVGENGLTAGLGSREDERRQCGQEEEGDGGADMHDC